MANIWRKVNDKIFFNYKRIHHKQMNNFPLMTVAPRQTEAKFTDSEDHSTLKSNANSLHRRTDLWSPVLKSVLNSVCAARTKVQLFPQSLHCGEVMLSKASELMHGSEVWGEEGPQKSLVQAYTARESFGRPVRPGSGSPLPSHSSKGHTEFSSCPHKPGHSAGWKGFVSAQPRV